MFSYYLKHNISIRYIRVKIRTQARSGIISRKFITVSWTVKFQFRKDSPRLGHCICNNRLRQLQAMIVRRKYVICAVETLFVLNENIRPVISIDLRY